MPLSGDIRRAKLYKLVYILDEKQIYIGSTTQKYLSSRLGSHKQNARYGRKDKRDKKKTPFEEYLYETGVDNWKIFLIPMDLSNIKNREELESIEFDVMRDYKEKGYTVLNYCQSKEDIKKYLSEARKEGIENDPNVLNKFRYFKYGSLYKDKGAWKFTWWENDKKKRRCKSFSINKYGEENAKKMAEEMRFEIFNISRDEYKDWLKNEEERKENEREKKEEEKMERKENRIIRKGTDHPNFNYGSIIRQNDHWRFNYRLNCKQHSKSFSFKKWGGEQEAYRLILEFQLSVFPELKNNNDVDTNYD